MIGESVEGRQKETGPFRPEEACYKQVWVDHPLSSGNGFASPPPMKTMRLLAITALMTALPVLRTWYVQLRVIKSK